MFSDLNNYNDTVDYLYGLQKHGIKLGLANTVELMNILGSPQNAFRSIHIAGTNGKGSTSAIIASILAESGFRVGLFTSPHLVSFTERIRINNRQIAESDVIKMASGIRKSIEGKDLRPTFFEFVTAMAFQYFALQNVDWAVVETGMGGRLDATNVLRPDIAVITNVSRDHCEFLGSGIHDITLEKAGIIKPGVPLITAAQTPGVVKLLSDIAASRGAGIHVYGKDFKGSLLHMDGSGITFDYSGDADYRNLSMPLTGRYQIYNACTAIRVCEILGRQTCRATAIRVRAGLQKVRLEGRLELISHSPPVFLDSAHNPEAADSLAASVREIFPDKKIILVAGIMNDKDAVGILQPLVRLAESVILTRPAYERAAPPEKLMEIIKDSGLTGSRCTIDTADTVARALELAKARCREDHIILVTGSFYTTGEAKEVSGGSGILGGLREYHRAGSGK
ncbi:MAG: bifunctional folylpolyglutamate synthase/dihydrofolate synthase [Deferribacteres bacterium]|nr:bifunctional folylpolyglutamate synthase/dihydrofolate synthase [Deferribacteres bacterium]